MVGERVKRMEQRMSNPNYTVKWNLFITILRLRVYSDTHGAYNALRYWINCDQFTYSGSWVFQWGQGEGYDYYGMDNK